MRLCHGPLRGMFDAPTSHGENVWDAPALSLDISRVAAGSATSDLALAITMVCATAFLDAKRMHRTLQAQRRRPGGARRRSGSTTRGGARCRSRGSASTTRPRSSSAAQTGVQHWMVLHRLSDLDAAGDHGTRQQALAKGLLAETGTVVVYRQHPEEAPRARQRSGSPAPRRSASATTRRASRCGGSAGAPTRCATSAPSASARSPRPTPRWPHANPAERPRSTPTPGSTPLEHQRDRAQHPARHVLLGPPPTALYLLGVDGAARRDGASPHTADRGAGRQRAPRGSPPAASSTRCASAAPSRAG